MVGSPLQTIAMVFSGGLGLAAYHAGVYEAFLRRGHPLHWVTGSSAGAVTAALIAGNDEAQRIEKLRGSGSTRPCIKHHMAAAVISAAGWARWPRGFSAAADTSLRGCLPSIRCNFAAFMISRR
jgi:predicted acylesterase/phospholipase RssA